MTITKGLVVASPHVERILAGTKTWEMRSTATTQRGRVALIRKGSGLVVGSVEITGCTEKLSPEQLLQAHKRHRIEPGEIAAGTFAKWNRGWTLDGARRLPSPIQYSHPFGAVIWVNLDGEVQNALARAGHA